MAIQNKIQFKGLIANSGYSRFLRGAVEVGPDGLKINATFQDFASAAAAEKILEDVKRPVVEDFDPTNEEHVRQWRANGGIDAEGKEVAYDSTKLNSEGKPWRPFVYATEKKWLGKTAEPALQERNVELPLEQALQILQRAVPGNPVDELPDNLVAEFYRAAMDSGAFSNAVAI